MDDSIYSYIKSRLKNSLATCGWDDNIGVMFERGPFQNLLHSLEALHNETSDVMDYISKAEKEIKNI